MLHPVNPTEVFVIIPAYNEQDVITRVIRQLVPFRYKLVVVDDGSAAELDEMLQPFPVYLLRHRVNLGQGAALQTGIEYALSKQAAYIVTFDADGQHLPSDIVKLLVPLAANKADITLGTRFTGGSSNISAGRKWVLKTARFVNYFFTGLLLSDAHNGLRAMTRAAASTIRIRQNGMAHATEILSEIRKKKLRYTEVPVSIRYTDYSRNKGQTVWGSFRIFFDILLNKIFK